MTAAVVILLAVIAATLLFGAEAVLDGALAGIWFGALFTIVVAAPFVAEPLFHLFLNHAKDVLSAALDAAAIGGVIFGALAVFMALTWCSCRGAEIIRSRLTVSSDPATCRRAHRG